MSSGLVSQAGSDRRAAQARYLVGLAVVAAVYTGSGKLGLDLAFESHSVTAIWPPTGIALSALILGGYRMWPAVALGALLTNVDTGVPAVTVLGITCGNTLEALVGAYLLRRVAAFRPSLQRVKDVLSLVVFGAVISTTVSATIGVASLLVGDAVALGHAASVWRTYWLGDMGGDLIVAPAILIAASERHFRELPGRSLEAAALTITIGGLSVLVFSVSTNVVYVLFPLLTFAALRFWQVGAAAANVLIATIAVVFTANGDGPFASSGPDARLLLAQTFVAVAGFTALIFAAVTRERRRADRAELANRAKSEFLARMSHELRTPLNAILGFAELLELEDLSRTERDGVGQITGSARRLLHLINDVLDVTRIESGQLRMSLEPVRLADVVDETVELMRPLASARQIRLITSFEPELRDLHVTADRQRLGQVLVNLVSNAVKYNIDGGAVTITSAFPVDHLARVDVADTGPGIPPEGLQQLFEPFERLGAEERNIEGTGLGLALSKSLIEAMNGRIRASSNVERGSTFTIELPLASAAAPAPGEPRDGDGVESMIDPETTGTVLYIEDSQTNIKLIEAILRRRPNVQLIPAETAQLGLELAREHAPPLILLDLHLPDEPGDAVLERLRRDPQTASARIAITSADASPSQIERLLAAGADDYITKPLSVRSLLELVDLALQRTRVAR